MNSLLLDLKDIAWGPLVLVLLVGTGIFFTVKLGFLQFTKFPYAMKNTIGKMFEQNNVKDGEISPFQAVSTALAATVGTGNIAGVTGAIAMGGPGAVFWMWISAIFGMVTKYSEIVLAIKYREKNEKGEWVGGPMYYIKNGLSFKFHFLAIVFCILGSVAAIGTGGMTQSNTIATSVNTTLLSLGFEINKYSLVIFGKEILISSLVIGILISIIISLVLFGGIKRIGAVTERIVPIMAIIYVSFGIILLIYNYQYIDDIIIMIFKSAFDIDAIIGGGFGITIITTIRSGVGRGVFSNEAGLGTSPMAHALTSETSPVKQGMYAIFEVFMDTIVICTLTAMILLCGYFNGIEIPWGQNASINLITESLGTLFGSQLSSLSLSICIALFALSTILTWSLYGARCFSYIFGEKTTNLYLIVFIVLVTVGSCLELNFVWLIAEMFNGFMIIPNLISLLLLSPIVIKTTEEFFKKTN